jgi:hypothetical protein
MKTAGRENPNRWAIKLSNRAHGAGGKNRPDSRWAVKVEKFHPWQRCFLLTFPFIELTRRYFPGALAFEKVSNKKDFV